MCGLGCRHQVKAPAALFNSDVRCAAEHERRSCYVGQATRLVLATARQPCS
jgi:hypothetical protein